jgi:hypothetical protein
MVNVRPYWWDQNLAPAMDANANQFAFQQPTVPQGGFNFGGMQ